MSEQDTHTGIHQVRIESDGPMGKILVDEVSIGHLTKNVQVSWPAGDFPEVTLCFAPGLGVAYGGPAIVRALLEETDARRQCGKQAPKPWQEIACALAPDHSEPHGWAEVLRMAMAQRWAPEPEAAEA